MGTFLSDIVLQVLSLWQKVKAKIFVNGRQKELQLQKQKGEIWQTVAVGTG